MNKQDIAKIVLDAIRDYLDSQDDDSSQVEVKEEMILFGDYAVIDSLGLVSIIVDIEMQFRDEGFDEFTLTSGEILTRTDSPFQTASTLINFISELIE